MDAHKVPVVVNSYNQPTYLRMMLTQLKRLGCRKLFVLDQGSTYPPLLDYLREIDKEVTVIRLRENHGPHWLFTSGMVSLLPEFFIYTDPDILFPATMPCSFVADMIRVARATRAAKVGLALDISRPDNIKQLHVTIGGAEYTIAEWERQFWRKPIRFRHFEVYKAPVDTTFALYNRDRFEPEIKKFQIGDAYYCMEMPASYRLAGPYTSVHMPWMLDDPIPLDELDYYAASRSNIHDY